MVLYLIAVIVPVSSVFIKEYLDVDGLCKQIPVAKVVVYLGVIALTFMDVFCNCEFGFGFKISCVNGSSL